MRAPTFGEGPALLAIAAAAACGPATRDLVTPSSLVAPCRDGCAPPPRRETPLPGSFCGAGAGTFWWDGAACRPYDCRCDMTFECARFESERACEASHAHCPAGGTPGR